MFVITLIAVAATASAAVTDCSFSLTIYDTGTVGYKVTGSYVTFTYGESGSLSTATCCEVETGSEYMYAVCNNVTLRVVNENQCSGTYCKINNWWSLNKTILALTIAGTVAAILTLFLHFCRAGQKQTQNQLSANSNVTRTFINNLLPQTKKYQGAPQADVQSSVMQPLVGVEDDDDLESQGGAVPYQCAKPPRLLFAFALILLAVACNAALYEPLLAVKPIHVPGFEYHTEYPPDVEEVRATYVDQCPATWALNLTLEDYHCNCFLDSYWLPDAYKYPWQTYETVDLYKKFFTKEQVLALNNTVVRDRIIVANMADFRENISLFWAEYHKPQEQWSCFMRGLASNIRPYIEKRSVPEEEPADAEISLEDADLPKMVVDAQRTLKRHRRALPTTCASCFMPTDSTGTITNSAVVFIADTATVTVNRFSAIYYLCPSGQQVMLYDRNTKLFTGSISRQYSYYAGGPASGGTLQFVVGNPLCKLTSPYVTFGNDMYNYGIPDYASTVNPYHQGYTGAAVSGTLSSSTFGHGCTFYNNEILCTNKTLNTITVSRSVYGPCTINVTSCSSDCGVVTYCGPLPSTYTNGNLGSSAIFVNVPYTGVAISVSNGVTPIVITTTNKYHPQLTSYACELAMSDPSSMYSGVPQMCGSVGGPTRSSVTSSQRCPVGTYRVDQTTNVTNNLLQGVSFNTCYNAFVSSASAAGVVLSGFAFNRSAPDLGDCWMISTMVGLTSAPNFQTFTPSDWVLLPPGGLYTCPSVDVTGLLPAFQVITTTTTTTMTTTTPTTTTTTPTTTTTTPTTTTTTPTTTTTTMTTTTTTPPLPTCYTYTAAEYKTCACSSPLGVGDVSALKANASDLYYAAGNYYASCLTPSTCTLYLQRLFLSSTVRMYGCSDVTLTMSTTTPTTTTTTPTTTTVPVGQCRIFSANGWARCNLPNAITVTEINFCGSLGSIWYIDGTCWPSVCDSNLPPYDLFKNYVDAVSYTVTNFSAPGCVDLLVNDPGPRPTTTAPTTTTTTTTTTTAPTTTTAATVNGFTPIKGQPSINPFMVVSAPICECYSLCDSDDACAVFYSDGLVCKLYDGVSLTTDVGVTFTKSQVNGYRTCPVIQAVFNQFMSQQVVLSVPVTPVQVPPSGVQSYSTLRYVTDLVATSVKSTGKQRITSISRRIPVATHTRRRRSAGCQEPVPEVVELFAFGSYKAKGLAFDGHIDFPYGVIRGSLKPFTVKASHPVTLDYGNVYETDQHTVVLTDWNGLHCRSKRDVTVQIVDGSQISLNDGNATVFCDSMATVCSVLPTEESQRELYLSQITINETYNRFEHTSYLAYNTHVVRTDRLGNVYSPGVVWFSFANTATLTAVPVVCGNVSTFPSAIYYEFKILNRTVVMFKHGTNGTVMCWYQLSAPAVTVTVDVFVQLSSNAANYTLYTDGYIVTTDVTVITVPDAPESVSVDDVLAASAPVGTELYYGFYRWRYMYVATKYFRTLTHFSNGDKFLSFSFWRYNGQNQTHLSLLITQPVCVKPMFTQGVHAPAPHSTYIAGQYAYCYKYAQSPEVVVAEFPLDTFFYLSTVANLEVFSPTGQQLFSTLDCYFIKPASDRCTRVFTTQKVLGALDADTIQYMQMRRLDNGCLSGVVEPTYKATTPMLNVSIYEHHHVEGSALVAQKQNLVNLPLMLVEEVGHIVDRKSWKGACDKESLSGCYNTTTTDRTFSDGYQQLPQTAAARRKRSLSDPVSTVQTLVADSSCVAAGDLASVAACMYRPQLIGVSVALGVLIVILILFCCCCRLKKSKYRHALELYSKGYYALAAAMVRMKPNHTFVKECKSRVEKAKCLDEEELKARKYEEKRDEPYVDLKKLRAEIRRCGAPTSKLPACTLDEEETVRYQKASVPRVSFALLVICVALTSSQFVRGPVQFFQTKPKVGEILASSGMPWDPTATYQSSDNVTTRTFQPPVGSRSALVVGGDVECTTQSCVCHVATSLGLLDVIPYSVLPLSLTCVGGSFEPVVQYITLKPHYNAVYQYTTTEWTFDAEMDYSCSGGCPDANCLPTIWPSTNWPVYINHLEKIAQSLSTCCYQINEGWLIEGLKMVLPYKRFVHVFELQLESKSSVICMLDAAGYKCSETPSTGAKLQVALTDVQVPDKIQVGVLVENGEVVRMFTGNFAKAGSPQWRTVGDIQFTTLRSDPTTLNLVWPSTSPVTWGTHAFYGCFAPGSTPHNAHWFTPYSTVTSGLAVALNTADYPDFADNSIGLRLRSATLSMNVETPVLELDMEYLPLSGSALIAINGEVDVGSNTARWNSAVSTISVTFCNFTVGSLLNSYCDLSITWLTDAAFSVTFEPTDLTAGRPSSTMILSSAITDYQIRFNVFRQVESISLAVKIYDEVVSTLKTNNLKFNKPPQLDQTTDTLSSANGRSYNPFENGPIDASSGNNVPIIIGCSVAAFVLLVFTVVVIAFVVRNVRRRRDRLPKKGYDLLAQ